MKKFIQATILVLSVILLAACGNGNTSGDAEKKDSASHEGHDQAKMEEGKASIASVQIKDDKLNAVYQHYVHLTTALTNGDMAEAKIAGNAIEAGAKQVAGGEAVAANATKITAATDIEAQRTAYAALSNDFIALVKKSGLDSGELYVDFCPMAMNEKGASWISPNKEIRNPYFGEKMMTCGEVKETIK
jgi:major membrane immunogen (membrane-anchored lipoprotein)